MVYQSVYTMSQSLCEKTDFDSFTDVGRNQQLLSQV